jgi:hypothetical protein
MELAAEEGVSIQFERYRQQLASETLPPLLRTQFELHVGRGYQTFGEFAAARTWLERAVQMASEHSFNQLLFEAEDALSKKEAIGAPKATTFEVSDEVITIASELKELRELVGA